MMADHSRGAGPFSSLSSTHDHANCHLPVRPIACDVQRGACSRVGVPLP